MCGNILIACEFTSAAALGKYICDKKFPRPARSIKRSTSVRGKSLARIWLHEVQQHKQRFDRDGERQYYNRGQDIEQYEVKLLIGSDKEERASLLFLLP